MAVCILYEIPSFLNLVLRNPDCSFDEQKSRLRSRPIWKKDDFVKTIQSMRQRSIGLYSPW